MDFLPYIFYAFFITGSVTLGYLLLRITIPEVRTLPYEMKMGSAGISGALLAIAAFGIDYLFGTEPGVVFNSGIYPIIIFALFLLSFVILKLYFVFTRPEFLTVGVPVASQPTITLQIERVERKVEPEVKEEIIGKRQGSDMRDRPQDSKADVIQRLRKDDMKVVAQENVELHKKEDFFSRITMIFSQKKDRKVPLDEMKKARIVPIETVSEGAGAKAPIDASPKIQRQMDAAGSGEGGEMSDEKTRQKIYEIRRKSAGGQGNNEAGGTDAGKQGPAQITPMAKPDEPRKGYMAMVGDIIGEEKKGSDGGKAQAISKPLGGDKPADAVKPQGEANAPQNQKQLDAGGHERLYVAAKMDQDEKAGMPSGFVRERFSTDPKLKEEQLKKASEAEAEAVMQDILPQDVLVKEVTQPPVDGHRHLYEVVQDRQSASRPQGGQSGRAQIASQPGGIMHRRYLIRNAESGESSGVSVVANASSMQSDNFDSMVSDVYSQLKSTKTQGIARDLKVAPPKGSSSKDAPRAEITFEDLLGDKPAEKKEGEGAGGSSIMAQLSGLTVGSSMSGGEVKMAGGTGSASSQAQAASQSPTSKTSIDFVKIEAEKGMGCPTCHAKNTKIIFCPYCGTGMCANCSPSIKIKEGEFVYTCPKCKEDVDIRKKSASPAGGKGLMGMGSAT